MARRETPDQAIVSAFRQKFESMSRAGQFKLQDIGIETFQELLAADPSEIRSAGAMRAGLETLGYKTDDEKLKYLMAYAAEHQEQICKQSDDVDASYPFGAVDKDGNFVEGNRDELLKRFQEHRKFDIPGQDLEDIAQQAADDAKNDPVDTPAPESGDASDGSQKGSGKQKQDAKEKEAQARYDENRKMFDEMLDQGLITEEECRQAKILLSLVQTMNASNPALKSLYNSASYIGSTTTGGPMVHFTAKRFEKFQRQHMKLSQDIGGTYDRMMADFKGRVGVTPGSENTAGSGTPQKGGFLGGMLGRIGRRKETPDAEESQGSGKKEGQNVFQKAGGTILKAGGVAVAVGAAVGKGLFKNVHPLLWVKNTYHDIADNIKAAINQNKDPANKKDRTTVEGMFQNMTRDDFFESGGLNPQFVAMVKANRDLFDYAVRITAPDGPDMAGPKDVPNASKDAPSDGKTHQNDDAAKPQQADTAKGDTGRGQPVDTPKPQPADTAKDDTTKPQPADTAKDDTGNGQPTDAAKPQPAPQPYDPDDDQPDDDGSAPDRVLDADTATMIGGDDDDDDDILFGGGPDDDEEDGDGPDDDQPDGQDQQDAAARTMQAQAEADDALRGDNTPTPILDSMLSTNRDTDIRAAAAQALENDDTYEDT